MVSNAAQMRRDLPRAHRAAKCPAGV